MLVLESDVGIQQLYNPSYGLTSDLFHWKVNLFLTVGLYPPVESLSFVAHPLCILHLLYSYAEHHPANSKRRTNNNF